MVAYLFPFVQVFNSILQIYAFLLVIWVILSLLDHFDVINSRHIFVMKIMRFLDALFYHPLSFIRRFIPIIGGVDISPLILYLFIALIRNLIVVSVY